MKLPRGLEHIATVGKRGSVISLFFHPDRICFYAVHGAEVWLYEIFVSPGRETWVFFTNEGRGDNPAEWEIENIGPGEEQAFGLLIKRVMGLPRKAQAEKLGELEGKISAALAKMLGRKANRKTVVVRSKSGQERRR